jgi:hypothetical protein
VASEGVPEVETTSTGSVVMLKLVLAVEVAWSVSPL